MSDKNLILAELEANGVIVNTDGTCSYMDSGKDVKESFEKAAARFATRAGQHKSIFNELWDDLANHLSNVPISLYEGSEATQRMFINGVRQVAFLAHRYKALQRQGQSIRKVLRMDSKHFSESYMAKTLEYTICINWVYHLLRTEIYKSYLLEKLEPKRVQASGAMGHINLDMSERVQVVGQEAEDELEHGGRLHPLYTRKFKEYDLQNGFGSYDMEDRIYRLINEPRTPNVQDERQPNRSLSRTT